MTKILHVVAGNLDGGAARGALVLHYGLLKAGMESRLIVQYGEEEFDGVIVENRSFIKKYVQKIIGRLEFLRVNRYNGWNGMTFSTGLIGGGVSKKHLDWADVVHLHWINKGMLSISQINKITKPLVWTIRDMWPFTGGCHYSMVCNKYEEGCGKCPSLGSQVDEDLSRKIFSKKISLLGNKEINFVGISEWLSSSLLRSKIFNAEKHTVETIYNSIDLSHFYPDVDHLLRNALGVKNSQKIVLSGAINNSALYKGGRYLVDVINAFSKRDDIKFILFGELGELGYNLSEKAKSNVISLGYISDKQYLRKVYTLADIFLAPSIQEGFGKTIVESMACGTPVLCFDSTGPKEIVTHLKTGYKAKPLNSDDLVNGLNYLISVSEEERNVLEKECIQKANTEYEVSVAVAKYKILYQKIIK